MCACVHMQNQRRILNISLNHCLIVGALTEPEAWYFSSALRATNFHNMYPFSSNCVVTGIYNFSLPGGLNSDLPFSENSLNPVSYLLSPLLLIYEASIVFSITINPRAWFSVCCTSNCAQILFFPHIHFNIWYLWLSW